MIVSQEGICQHNIITKNHILPSTILNLLKFWSSGGLKTAAICNLPSNSCAIHPVGLEGRLLSPCRRENLSYIMTSRIFLIVTWADYKLTLDSAQHRYNMKYISCLPQLNHWGLTKLGPIERRKSNWICTDSPWKPLLLIWTSDQTQWQTQEEASMHGVAAV